MGKQVMWEDSSVKRLYIIGILQGVVLGFTIGFAVAWIWSQLV